MIHPIVHKDSFTGVPTFQCKDGLLHFMPKKKGTETTDPSIQLPQLVLPMRLFAGTLEYIVSYLLSNDRWLGASDWWFAHFFLQKLPGDFSDLIIFFEVPTSASWCLRA